jgi:rRNA-processing protein FCF1
MKTVILDTNALMMPVQFKIDLEKQLTRLVGPCDIIVPSTVVAEVQRLAEHEGKLKEAAAVATALINRFKVVQVQGTGDNSIRYVAREYQGIVVTNDRMLRRQLREAKHPVIYLRGKKRLEMEGVCD